jgi:hypothetical protein
MADLAAAQQHATEHLTRPDVADVADRYRRGAYTAEWAHHRLAALGIDDVWVRIYVLSAGAR